MRIQNNITAMNTHRQYTINNDNVAKAAEKLSSGYRINRAGDDAAGLAISEKMRSQIRGLNMATKNSQDAISLVQTAEGALQETHAMLQRMNELAVQAATGTNQEEDRLALAKEFQQLKREINDVAEQTTFNNMKILDGSLSYTGYVRSAQTAGVTNTASEVKTAAAVEVTQQTTAADASDDYDPTSGTAASFQITLTGTNFTIAADNGVAGGGPADGSGGTATIDITFNGTTVTLESEKNQAGTAVNAAAGAAALFNGTSVEIDGVTYDVTNNANVLTLTAQDKVDTDFSGANAPTATIATGGGTATVSGTPTSGEAPDGTPASKEKYTATIDLGSLKAGDKLTFGDAASNYSYTVTEADLATGKTVSDLVNAIKAANNNQAPTGTTLTAVGNVITVETTAAGEAEAGKAKIEFTPVDGTDAAKYKNTIEFDTAKMKDGDVFELNVGGKPAKIIFDSSKFYTDATSSASEKMAEAAAKALQAVGVTGVSAKGNAILFTGDKVSEEDIKLTSATTDTAKYPTNAIRIQVGALEDEQLAVSIDAMNTAGLGLDGFNLDTQNEAGMAITAVRDAVQKVSDQRATLGAMQNRLDHKIANLKVSSENLSAAESRIRDVDMASEMTNFTKNNILSQAATAMLAQANALPQNVLSLLG